MYVCDCVCVGLVVRHSVGGLLNPAGYSGLESYRALDLSRSLSLSVFLLLVLTYTFTHAHRHCCRDPLSFLFGCRLCCSITLELDFKKLREKSVTFGSGWDGIPLDVSNFALRRSRNTDSRTFSVRVGSYWINYLLFFWRKSVPGFFWFVEPAKTSRTTEDKRPFRYQNMATFW